MEHSAHENSPEPASDSGNGRSASNNKALIGCLALGGSLALLFAIANGAFSGPAGDSAVWMLVAAFPLIIIAFFAVFIAIAVRGAAKAKERAPAGTTELPLWFGVTQIVAMIATFAGLATVNIARGALTNFQMNPIAIPDNLGVIAALWIAIEAVRIRDKKANTWSVVQYERLAVLQRLFTVPMILGLFWFLMTSPQFWFDDSSVGSAEGIAYNHMMGYLAYSIPIIGTSAALISWALYGYFRTQIAPFHPRSK